LRRRTWVTAVAVAAATATIAAGAQPAQAAPRGFFGVVPSSIPQPSEFQQMARGGAGGVRFLIYWRQVQSVDGSNYDWSQVDPIVAGAAQAGLPLLPFIYGTPAWAADCSGIPNGFCDRADPLRTPAGRAGWRTFVTAAFDRYGPNGTFWSDTGDGFNPPKLPIREWQIWNEPSMTRYWTTQPFAKSYVSLLRAAYTAVKAADPHAKVILAGLPNESWKALRTVYAAGARGHFDAVALHPYTGKPRNVIRLIELARSVMRRAHDPRTPVWVTELSWPAALGKVPLTHGFETTDRGQAVRLAQGLERLLDARRRLRIGKVVWYTWLSVEGGENSFAWSGLRRVRGSELISAPALAAFRAIARRLEGCAKPSGDASRCA
jgi:hypothetical protein